MAENREIGIFNNHPALQFENAEIDALFRNLDQWNAYRIPPGELSIAFLSDHELAKLHRSFLDDPAPTDVITFPASGSDSTQPDAGEICVSVDAAGMAAIEYGQSFAVELTLYLVHGWLHLAGLMDKTADDREKMRNAESRALAYLTERSAIPEFMLKSSTLS